MQKWDIVFRDLTVGYGSKAVLTNINATLPAGEISVVLGASGGGKSTLLRHVIGLQKPLAGQILIGGVNIFALSSRAFRRLRRRMGVLFQDGALLGSLTSAENVALPLSEHLRLPKKALREAALRALTMVDLASAADYYPNQLSGGMRKRAGLARALIAEPLILLCDEPTSGLDPLTAARMDDLLLAMHAHYPAMTIVVVSHDLASLKRVADYVLMLKDGRVAYAGSLKGLMESNDPYLRSFLRRESDKADFNDFPPPNPLVAKELNKWFDS